MIRRLLQRWLLHHMRYEVFATDEDADPWIVWLGRGSGRLADGFYLTAEAARRAAKTAPPGYRPHIFEIPPGACVKVEVSL